MYGITRLNGRKAIAKMSGWIAVLVGAIRPNQNFRHYVPAVFNFALPMTRCCPTWRYFPTFHCYPTSRCCPFCYISAIQRGFYVHVARPDGKDVVMIGVGDPGGRIGYATGSREGLPGRLHQARLHLVWRKSGTFLQ